MSPSYFLVIYMAGVAVEECCSDSVPTPNILLFPGHISVATAATVRCESPKCSGCHFYRDQDRDPIREVDYNGICQFKLFWNEFKHWNKTEVDFSCVILQEIDGKLITSKRSDKIRLQVSDAVGKPKIHLDQAGNYFNLRCEAKHGTRCHFYLNNNDIPFKTQPYAQNVCVVRLAQEELMKEMRKMSGAGEIFITCAVELLTEGEDSVTVLHSEPRRITVDGSVAAFSTTAPGEESPESTVPEPTGLSEQDFSSQSSLSICLRAAAYFIILLVEYALCRLWYKQGGQQCRVNRRKQTCDFVKKKCRVNRRKTVVLKEELECSS